MAGIARAIRVIAAGIRIELRAGIRNDHQGSLYRLQQGGANAIAADGAEHAFNFALVVRSRRVTECGTVHRNKWMAGLFHRCKPLLKCGSCSAMPELGHY